MATATRTPDAELLERLRARDRTAWEELYAEYQPRLRRFAYRLAGNVHDADDLVQETFVRAVPRLDGLDPRTADVGAYLFATLRNLFLKQVEQRRRQHTVADVPEPAVPTPIDLDPERSLLLARQQDEVRLANGRLQPRQRLVLALRELEERSYADIGEIVGLKENAVAQLIFRARESLRVELRLAQVDPDRFPEACRAVLPLLAAHLDGELRGARREQALGHLEACERCQAALADMREASRRYRLLLLPPLAEADEARAAVEQRLDEAGYWRRGGVRAGRVALLAGAVLALGGAGAAVGVVLAEEEQRAAAPTVTTSRPTAARPPAATAAPGPKGAVGARIGGGAGSAQRPQPAAPGATEPAAVESTTSPPSTAAKPTTAATTGTSPTRTAVAAPEVATPAKPKAKQPPPPPKGQPPAKEQPKPPAKEQPKPAPDTTAPTVTITNAPAASHGSDRAEIAFTANEAGAVFACRLGQAPFTPCASPVVLEGLAPGAHVFAVRATDAAGNVGAAATVAWTYTVPDTTAPTVTISASPPASTVATSATFEFTADEPDVAFACSLDGAVWSACTSPVSYTALAVGAHTFSVRGADAAGNVGAPAVASWTVVPLLPDLVVSAFGKNAITIRNQGQAAASVPSVLTITLIGTYTVPPLPPGASVTFTWSICRVGTYRAIVDRTEVVAESNEANNTASRANTCP
jgi:RNA polymerase sigma factor (sigma-70 family)